MSYDTMTAHVSIVLARYMLLSLEQRRKIDKRSIGELFYVSCDKLQDLQYMDALIMVLKKLVSMITEKWLFLEKQLNAMLDSFLENLPDLWHNCLNRDVHDVAFFSSQFPMLRLIEGLFRMCEV